jgi:REP element-mobilizing transposase RayT
MAPEPDICLIVRGMSRPLRIQFPGALYHVTSRGDGREAIYRDDRDRIAFLAVLAHTCERFNWVCHGYCLMTNHYHLLVETPDANLTLGMRQLNGMYTQRFNRRHARVGHVFQGRYHAVLVQKESHLLEVARYIVLNPVRAGLVRSPRSWRWSSYGATAGLADTPAWLCTGWLLKSFGGEPVAASQAYRRFVDDGTYESSPWEQLKQQIYLGDDDFVASTQARIAGNSQLDEIPSAQRRPVPRSLESYENEAVDRKRAIVTAYRSGGYSMRAIGRHFGLHLSRVSQILLEIDDPNSGDR